MNKTLKVLGLLALAILPFSQAHTQSDTLFWMKIHATNKFERTAIAETGVSIEAFRDDYVIAVGHEDEKAMLEKMGNLEVSFPLTEAMDFPAKDSVYHNFEEMTSELRTLTAAHPAISKMTSIGKTTEGRDIWSIRICGDMANASKMPGVMFMGGHHAREHLSIELPIAYIQYLLSEYDKGTPRIVNLINARDIHIIPMVNADGAEYDISTGNYKMWRKNRARNAGGTAGVDLNRNYGYGWGGGGASTSPSADTYRGPAAFSEPETQAIKKYVDDNVNVSILLSFHTFSKLILYPWGHAYESISNTRDKQVHETMARKMATWNGYTPQQSSELYIASGDTTDWSYGEHKIISFTFELDPGENWGMGGFYPGAAVIPDVIQKNLEPVLYLIEYADNPYRAIDTSNDPIFKP
jgi:carboxypeptidase T